MAKRGTLDHPKTFRLARALKVEPWAALGLLEALWHWVGRHHPTGCLTGVDPKELAMGLRATRSGQKIIEILVQERWLDAVPSPSPRLGLDEVSALYVHDWPDHAEDTTKKQLRRLGKWFDPYYQQVKPFNVQDSEVQCPGQCPGQGPEVLTDSVQKISLSSRAGLGLGSCSSSSEGVQGEPLGDHLEAHPLPGADDISRAWERTVAEFPGEVIPKRDMQAWLTALSVPTDFETFFAVLAGWKATRKWQDGYPPSLFNYLRNEQWKVFPKPDPLRRSRTAEIMEQI